MAVTKTRGFVGDDTNFQFDVKREPLFLSTGQPTGKEALYRTDTGACLSVVSPGYRLTTHGAATDFVEQLLTRKGVAFKVGKTAVASKGNQFYREIQLTDMKFAPVGKSTALDGNPTDEYIPRIILRNSYNRTSSLDFLYGNYRFACENGMLIGDNLMRISIRHLLAPDFDKIGKQLLLNIDESTQQFQSHFTRLNGLPAVAYSSYLLLGVLTPRLTLTACGLSQGKLKPIYDGEELVGVDTDPSLTAYALLQIATQVATHHVKKFHRSVELQRQIAIVFGL